MYNANMKRKKILIIEHDDFLREILGNLLYKKGNYILNGSCVERGLIEAKNQKIDTVILGTSCKQYNGSKSIHYIKKQLGDIDFFILNSTDSEIDFISKNKQIKISELSIKRILEKID